MASPKKKKFWSRVVKEKPVFISRDITARIAKKSFEDVSVHGIERTATVAEPTKDLLRVAGVPLNTIKEDEFERYAERLEEAKTWYHAREVQEEAPSPNERRAALQEVKNRAHAFVVSMLELDQDSKDYLGFNLDGAISRENTVDCAWHYAGRVEQAATDAINALPKSDRGRRKSTVQQNVILYHLHPIYKDLTNKDPFKTTSKQAKSRFFDFVERFLQIIGRPAQSRDALKMTLYRLKVMLSRTKKTSPKKKRP